MICKICKKEFNDEGCSICGICDDHNHEPDHGVKDPTD
jgi:hypothetical protein